MGGKLTLLLRISWLATVKVFQQNFIKLVNKVLHKHQIHESFLANFNKMLKPHKISPSSNLHYAVCTYAYKYWICGIFGGGFNLAVWQLCEYCQIKCMSFRL